MEFMTHPEHGAIYTNDIGTHEANGWQIATAEDWLNGKAIEAKQEAKPEPKKRGRAPKASQ